MLSQKLLLKNGGKVWYNDSDAMIDYFDIAYYVHINVGKWNKQYEIVEYGYVNEKKLHAMMFGIDNVEKITNILM